MRKQWFATQATELPSLLPTALNALLMLLANVLIAATAAKAMIAATRAQSSPDRSSTRSRLRKYS